MVYLAISILVGILIILAVVAATYLYYLKDKEFKKTGKYPVGHYMEVGMVIGMPIGFILSFFISRITYTFSLFPTLGPIFGAGFGIAIGSALEQAHVKELRILTKHEEKIKFWKMLVLSGILLIGVIALLLIYFI